ncbi:hypothetical protein GGI21_003349 [Coemansia aciculifera]|uniref:Uncharacterized protein n=1 Tax=Coemansia aciculifera TaxID=417176 RepID=A0ACC1M1I6_9FUNG|nr:hypothetical protein IWW38_003518 [Coemansia aciculifera]KAJ2907975.1 hypothetical protein GGI21_003349 [Coemansia aciculifera]
MTSDSAAPKFQLKVVQQPQRARVFSAGERDRRPIDPCPIVKVQEIQTGGTVVDIEDLDCKYIVNVQLFSENGATAIDQVPISMVLPIPMVVDSSQNGAGSQAAIDDGTVHAIFGEREASVRSAKDLDDEQKAFYCFPNMRVRIVGRFRLNFSMFYLPSEGLPSGCSIVLATAMSEVFTVYSVRDFPGIGKTTALSKKLSSQGIPIPNRNKDRLKPNEEESADE